MPSASASAMANRRSLFADLALGSAAGAAATWAMDRATTFLYERQPKATRKREKAVRGRKTAYEQAAEKVAGLAGMDIDAEQRKALGKAIHWSIGIASGALYGLLRNRSRHIGAGSGLAFGLALYLAVDEGLLTVAKLAPSPSEFPWQTHARGLAGHLILGAILDAAFDVTDLIPTTA